LSGCSSFRSYFWGDKMVDIPDMTMPVEVKKPTIKSVTLKVDEKVYVAYTVHDSMDLYTYLVEQEAYVDKLKYRINLQNELIKKFGNQVK